MILVKRVSLSLLTGLLVSFAFVHDAAAVLILWRSLAAFDQAARINASGNADPRALFPLIACVVDRDGQLVRGPDSPPDRHMLTWELWGYSLDSSDPNR